MWLRLGLALAVVMVTVLGCADSEEPSGPVLAART